MKNLHNQQNQRQIPLILNKPTEIQVKHGIIGSNQETLSAVKNFLYSKCIKNRSFIVWGDKGSGKSFWLKAWANEMSNSKYFNLKNDILTESEGKHILIIDNLELSSNFNQAFLFKLFSLPSNANTKIFAGVSKDFILNDRVKFREDLRTRLKQGLVYKLNVLSDDDKRDALKQYIYSVGWVPHQDDNKYDFLIDYMLTRFPRQLPYLKHILIKTNDLAISSKCPVTIPFMKAILEKIPDEK